MYCLYSHINVILYEQTVSQKFINTQKYNALGGQ